MNKNISDFQRFKNNIEALKLIALKSEGDLNYNELSNLFSGFGNFPYFTMPINDILSEKFDSNSTKKYFEEIRQLIRELNTAGISNDSLKSVFQKIARSALYAYFTDKNYVDQITRNLLLQKIDLINESSSKAPFMILEPSAGTGVFAKSIIDNIRLLKEDGLINNEAAFRIFAIEPEVISYRILSSIKNEIKEDDNIVYTAHNSKFENFQVLNDRKFDIITSNIPFGSTKIQDELISNNFELKKAPNIHSYFFLKSSLLLKNDGDIGFITSSNFLDSPGNEIDRALFFQDNNTVKNVVRLPKETFLGTEVQTDYIQTHKKSVVTELETKVLNEIIQSLSINANDLFITEENNPNKNKDQDYNINAFVYQRQNKIVLGDLQTNFMHNGYTLSSTLKDADKRLNFFSQAINNPKFDTHIEQTASLLKTPGISELLNVPKSDTDEFRVKNYVENFNKDLGYSFTNATFLEPISINEVENIVQEIKKKKVSKNQFKKQDPAAGIQLSLFDFENEIQEYEKATNSTIDRLLQIEKEEQVKTIRLTSKELEDENVFHYSGAYITFKDQVFILDHQEGSSYISTPLLNFAEKDKQLLSLKNDFLQFQNSLKKNHSDIVQRHHHLINKYREYTNNYGNINESLLFFKDDKYALEFAGLEIKNKLGKFIASDLLNNEEYFTELDKEVKTPEQALIKSLQKYNGQVKIQYICKLLNVETEDKKLEVARHLVENGKIFNDYYIKDDSIRYKFSTKEEFVSGNVPEKIRILEHVIQNEKSFDYMSDSRLREDLSTLKQHDISIVNFEDLTININAEWLDKKFLEKFLQNKFEYYSEDFFEFTKFNGFLITKKSFKDNFGLNSLSVDAANRTISGGEVLKDIINDKSFNFTTKVKDGDREFYVKDIKANKDAELKAKMLKKEWKSFINGLSPEEHKEILNSYNETFCTNVPKVYNGSYLDFSDVHGINDAHQHQKDVVSMILQNDGGVVDHKVGAGKSLVMFSSTMKMKQSGLKNKPMLAVTRATAEQIYKEFKFHYPDAKIFFDTSELDENTKLSSEEKRIQKYSMIANNDWDCVIMTHEEIAKIPIPLEIQVEYTQEILDDLRDNIYYKKQLKDEGVNVGDLKRLEKQLESEEAKLEKMFDKLNSNKDSTIYDFNSLGVDHLMIDEAHKFKNMPFTTIHSGVAGLSTQSSERAKHYAMLTRALRNNYNLKDGGVTVLSGTFISNSMAEIYNLMNWIKPERLKELNINTFDRFAKNFFVKESQQELSVGNAVKEKERFRYIVNVPELKSLYLEMAHVVNDSNFTIETPDVKTEMVIIEANSQQERFNDLLVDFIDGNTETALEFEGIIQKSFDDQQKQASSLIVSNLSQKNGIDPRLINDEYFIEPGKGKLQQCAEKINDVYQLTNDLKGVQLVFCDLGIPNSKNKDQFNVYDGLRDILVEKYGINRNEIQFAHDWRAASGTKKDKALRKEFQDKLNSGEFRIAIGSTETLGTGMNVQKKCIAEHDLDIPWTPSKTEQRKGRMKRQGNEIAKEFDNTVFNYKYLAKKSLDAFRSQANETKEKFLNVFKKIGADSPRILDEGEIDGDGNGTNYSLMKAYILDNPQMLEIAKLETKLENLYNNKEAIENEGIKINRNFNYFSETLEKEKSQLNIYKEVFDNFKNTFEHFNPETLENHPEILLFDGTQKVEGIQDMKLIGKELRNKYEQILKTLDSNNIRALEPFRTVISGAAAYKIPLCKVGPFDLSFNITNVSFNDVKKGHTKIMIENNFNSLRMQKRVDVISKDPGEASTIIFNELSKRIPKLIENVSYDISNSEDKLHYYKNLRNEFKRFDGDDEIEKVTKQIIDLKQEIEFERQSKKIKNRQSL
ncbi:hypothetical protein C1631_022955 [Chryseobacterium phosphatilyticum]|uniref:DNA methylase n=1 Tax=Chryseobacterium phosphatilyticum TaxID=475075 RepID=A0A316WMF8_9FLAO|nr:DEAD/DEAH box helicase family protein [Chryseobacterium phosphatilyticum]PWN62427.1 hypothetical protein C1631_022955 [Chryseobacterium phosphatilyticum]